MARESLLEKGTYFLGFLSVSVEFDESGFLLGTWKMG